MIPIKTPTTTTHSRRALLLGGLATATTLVATACRLTSERSTPTPAQNPEPTTTTRPAPERGPTETATPASPSPTVTSTTSASARVTPRSTATSESTLDPAVIADLERLAYPIATTEPGHGYDDLEPLRELVGDAHIVSLGEATHGTHEFFTMKHRLIQYLVKEVRFNVVAVEVPWPVVKSLSRYVSGETDNVNEAVANLGFPIATQEFNELVEWLREHNSTAGAEQQVTLSGFDMQFGAELAIQDIQSYLKQVDPGALEQFVDHFAVLTEPGATETIHERHLATAETIFAALLARREDYIAASSPAAFEDALQDARVLVQGQDLELNNARHGPGYQAQVLRDRYMSENVDWLLLQNPGARALVWAHNSHVGYQPRTEVDAPSMGSYMKARYGDGLVTIGLDLGSGAVTAIGQDGEVGKHTVPSPLPSMAESVFAQLTISRFMLDLHAPNLQSPAADWLGQPQSMWTIPGRYWEEVAYAARTTVTLPHQFDVLLFIEDTTASAVTPPSR